MQRGWRDAPLYVASVCGRFEVVRLFLQHGAAINVANNDEKTPPYDASDCGMRRWCNCFFHTALRPMPEIMMERQPYIVRLFNGV
jgi:hypothetical protein